MGELSNRMCLDVVVVGAGVSGLVAARSLRRAGLRVCVLEARDRVGGRTYSVPFGSDTVDLGGQWIGPTQDRVIGLCKELQIETFLQYHRGKKQLEYGGELRSFRGLLPKVGLMGLLEAGWQMWQLSKMARSVPLDAPHLCPQARRWDAIDVGQWLYERVKRPEARALLRIATQMIYAEEPEAISFLYFLFYIHSGGNLARLSSIPQGAQERRFVGGAQQLALKLAQELSDELHLQQPLLSLELSDAEVTLRTEGQTYSAPHAILAIPPALCHDVQLSGSGWPSERVRLHNEMRMGAAIKCIVSYERAFWREAGFSGEAICTLGGVRAVFDETSHDGTQPALLAFLVGDDARHWSAQGPEARRAMVLETLVRLFGPEAAQPKDYIDQDWISEPYSRGCYVGLMPPGLLTDIGDALRCPIERLHFAGTETATRWAGYIDGAIEAGERAAHEILARR